MTVCRSVSVLKHVTSSSPEQAENRNGCSSLKQALKQPCWFGRQQAKNQKICFDACFKAETGIKAELVVRGLFKAEAECLFRRLLAVKTRVLFACLISV